MGKYLNPGNSGFRTITNGHYVDKTGMIALINATIDTPQKLTCISRPRRFGKSFAAQMLCAYYDHTCDSAELFDKYQICREKSYADHLNRYNVIYLDVTGFISGRKQEQSDLKETTKDITEAIREEIIEDVPQLKECRKLTDCLIRYADVTGRRFIFIIDEWDALIREAKKDPDTQEIYLNLLREWFKNGNFTPQVVAAAYMTGILPIKKDGSESAISDFCEYTILNPGAFASFTGFTTEEVASLCKEYDRDFDTMKEWYDGYSFAHTGSIYNPYSVMTAIRMSDYGSFWQKTSATEALPTYVDMNYDGLQDAIIRLIAGEQLEVNVNGFDNDVARFRNRDDVLTLLVHLGYLAYDPAEKTVKIPNKEVENEFHDLLRDTGRAKLFALVQTSEKLLKDTLAGNEDAVAAAIDRVRESSYAPAYYNNEQALRYVIKFAYITCVDQYLRLEELPSGKGIADVVFVPKKRSPLPAMIIELKWDRSESAAIQQIKDNNYPSALKDYGGELLLVGINYSETTKKHTCRIETLGQN